MLPLSPGRAERHGFEYYRHGTLSLFAAFNTRTGDVLGKTAQRHTSAEFVAFLSDLMAHQPKRQEIHFIADNLSAHKTSKVEEFLARHPNVHLHFTPTYSSWLNQVELWFAKVQRDVIARGIFTSIKDLDKKLMRYIRQYNQKPKTVKWKYFDPTSRITCQSTVTAHWFVRTFVDPYDESTGVELFIQASERCRSTSILVSLVAHGFDGGVGAFQPPPRAWTRSTAAVMRWPRIWTAVVSFVRAIVSALVTPR